MGYQFYTKILANGVPLFSVPGSWSDFLVLHPEHVTTEIQAQGNAMTDVATNLVNQIRDKVSGGVFADTPDVYLYVRGNANPGLITPTGGEPNYIRIHATTHPDFPVELES